MTCWHIWRNDCSLPTVVWATKKKITNECTHSKEGRLVLYRNRLYHVLRLKNTLISIFPTFGGTKWRNWIWNEHESWKEVMQEWPKTTENYYSVWTKKFGLVEQRDCTTGAIGIRTVMLWQCNSLIFKYSLLQRNASEERISYMCVIKQDSVQSCSRLRYLSWPPLLSYSGFCYQYWCDEQQKVCRLRPRTCIFF